MNKRYLALVSLFLCVTLHAQDISSYAYRVKGPVPVVKNNVNRTEGNITHAYINYIQSDSAYYPLSYFMEYMFYMNSRYTLSDTGNPMSNQLLIRNFSVLFDTVVDATLDTAYNPVFMQGFTIDSLSIILGQCNHSGLQDTIIVQIDSVDANGYITDTVLHADTVLTGITGMSPSNNWLNPINLVVKTGYALDSTTRFAVKVSYNGSKFDTLGFLPGFGDTNCISGGSGPVPRPTFMGYKFGALRANSLTYGYQYFFGSSQTVPSSTGNMYGLYVPCNNPLSKYWYFQDNPISAYISFTNLTGINEVNGAGYSISQNYPNPFNHTSAITYNLASASDVQFYVTDLTGRIMLNMGTKRMSPGRHVINLNAGQLSPGIYLYTFNINGSRVSRKMVISQ